MLSKNHFAYMYCIINALIELSVIFYSDFSIYCLFYVSFVQKPVFYKYRYSIIEGSIEILMYHGILLFNCTQTFDSRCPAITKIVRGFCLIFGVQHLL